MAAVPVIIKSDNSRREGFKTWHFAVLLEFIGCKYNIDYEIFLDGGFENCNLVADFQ